MVVNLSRLFAAIVIELLGTIETFRSMIVHRQSSRVMHLGWQYFQGITTCQIMRKIRP